MLSNFTLNKIYTIFQINTRSKHITVFFFISKMCCAWVIWKKKLLTPVSNDVIDLKKRFISFIARLNDEKCKLCLIKRKSQNARVQVSKSIQWQQWLLDNFWFNSHIKVPTLTFDCVEFLSNYKPNLLNMIRFIFIFIFGAYDHSKFDYLKMLS